MPVALATEDLSSVELYPDYSRPILNSLKPFGIWDVSLESDIMKIIIVVQTNAHRYYI